MNPLPGLLRWVHAVRVLVLGTLTPSLKRSSLGVGLTLLLICVFIHASSYIVYENQPQIHEQYSKLRRKKGCLLTEMYYPCRMVVIVTSVPFITASFAT